MTGWWLGHPSEKYEFVNWDDECNPILMGKNGNQLPPTRSYEESPKLERQKDRAAADIGCFQFPACPAKGQRPLIIVDL